MPGPASHTVHLADAREMPELDDGSIHLVCTSPPYWQLKDYEAEGQIGYGDDFATYVAKLNEVWAECVRVLVPGGRLCINIGDQYTRSKTYGRYKVIPIRTEIVRACEGLGLDAMGAIIWRKVTTCNTSGGGTVMGSYPFPRNGIVKYDYEFILLFKKRGRTPPPSAEAKEASRIELEEWKEWFSGHWSFPGARGEDHIAPFPEELPARLIRMFTFRGETVLDPFLGSGTTSRAAGRAGRSSVGYEIDPDAVPVIRRKVGELGPDDATSDLRILRPERDPLPDPEPVDSSLQTTPKDREAFFGSVVRASDRDRTRWEGEHVRVASVPDPTTLELADGREVRLRGLRDPAEADLAPTLREAAVRRLAAVAVGEEVVLSHREEADGTETAEARLSDRTSLSRLLVKGGLALPDDGPRGERLRDAADEAREAGRGVWADGDFTPSAPIR